MNIHHEYIPVSYTHLGNFYKKQGKDLIDVLNELYEKHGTFKESQIALSKAGAEGAKRIKEIMDNLRKDAPAKIGDYKVVAIEDYQSSEKIENGATSTIDLPKSNVLKYYLEDGSWIAARPSGTCLLYTSSNDIIYSLLVGIFLSGLFLWYKVMRYFVKDDHIV